MQCKRIRGPEDREDPEDQRIIGPEDRKDQGDQEGWEYQKISGPGRSEDQNDQTIARIRWMKRINVIKKLGRSDDLEDH